MKPLIEFLDAISAMEGFGTWADAENMAPEGRKLIIIQKAFWLASEGLVNTACKAQKMLILSNLKNVKPEDVDMAIINAPEPKIQQK